MRKRQAPTVAIAAETKAETELAIKIFDGMQEIWIPKILIERPEEIPVPAAIHEIEVEQWFAEQEGLI